MIPGNEKGIGDMINQLMLRGCKVIYSSLQNVHVSGHACQEEIKLMHSLVQEQYFIPAHGEPRMMLTHKKLALDLGMDEEHVLMAENGSVIEFNRVGNAVVANMDEKVQAGKILIDGLGIGDVGSVVLNDRKRLSDDGMIALVVTVDRKTRKMVAGPEVISRGFIYMKDNVDLIEEMKGIVSQIFRDAQKRNITDWAFLKSRIREEVKSYVYKEIQRNPMILTIIMETDGHDEA